MTDSANGDGSLYIADGARGGNIPKSWADAIFQHKPSEIGVRVLRSRIRLLSLVGETSRYKYCHIM